MTAPTPRPLGPALAVLALWALALALSAGLVAAGERWPEPLVPVGAWVWGLVLVPPLLMALWLLRSWRLEPAASRGQALHPDRGESID
ncbi:MAG: hypothetical protein FJ054_02455 [Cyanobacteria bacterium M_surface_10_m2_119]|nr:hypothetical protein [Cyanobacteria bacterium M_surface_10_m2_119]